MATKTKVSVDDGVDFSQFLSFSGVQSAANAFLQVTIPTNIVPNNGFILNITEVVAVIDQVGVAGAGSPQIDFSLTRVTKSAIPTLADPDIIAKYRNVTLGIGVPTAAMGGIIEMPVNLTYSGKQIIASQNVFLQFSTSGFASAMNISGRIYYEQLNMPKDRILEILYG